MTPASNRLESPAGPDAVLRALADPHRREIVRLVRDAEMPAGQIAATFTLTQQAVSQHLMVLKRAGVLDERRDGTRRLYRFRPQSLEPVRDLLSEFWPDALERLKRVVERDHPRPETTGTKGTKGTKGTQGTTRTTGTRGTKGTT